MVERVSREASGDLVTVVHQGHRYRIRRRRSTVGGPGTVTETWPGRGVIGSYRRWLGHRHTKRLIWYAAVNLTGQPYAATRRVDELPSRRAAVRWLLAETGPDPATNRTRVITTE